MVYPRHAVTCVGGSLYALAARQFASSGWANLNIRKTVYGPLPEQRSIRTQFRRRQARLTEANKEDHMLRWAAAFFIIALIAAYLGFGGVALAAAGAAKILFLIFIVLFVLALVGGLARRGA